tara:strand:+ start:1017 stop:1229 length:213 start_codon:yes stop_codon:yes gene_type:complete
MADKKSVEEILKKLDLSFPDTLEELFAGFPKGYRKKGARFTVDSKGNVTKNYKNGGAVMSGRGGSFKGVR